MIETCGRTDSLLAWLVPFSSALLVNFCPCGDLDHHLRHLCFCLNTPGLCGVSLNKVDLTGLWVLMVSYLMWPTLLPSEWAGGGGVWNDHTGKLITCLPEQHRYEPQVKPKKNEHPAGFLNCACIRTLQWLYHVQLGIMHRITISSLCLSML